MLGIENDASAVIDGFLAQFLTSEGASALNSIEQVQLLRDELRNQIAYAFTHTPDGGTHDRTGAWNDPSQWDEEYVHSIDTLESGGIRTSPEGWETRITMAGGAPWVEFESQAHLTESRHEGSDWLVFQPEEGEWRRAETVEHPYWPGEDFVGRAFEATQFARTLDAALVAFVSHIHA